jgi:hydrogenase maturation protein HypF
MNPAAAPRVNVTGRRIEIRGIVQGVGFRPWVYRLAREEALGGQVRNDAAGVTIEAFGAEVALESFCRRLRSEAPPAARIRHFQWQTLPQIPAALAGDFRIVASATSEGKRLSIPADLATCEACREELLDPADRRHGYPFTNCTDCGPRYTIAHGVPYDRPATSMAAFPLCPECRREYDDPGDRRFHAQPNACPVCGPKLELLLGGGSPVATADPLAAAAQALREGRVVAVKGLGGFHLACDATSSAAIRRLRERKAREEKPFAVMLADLATAHRLAKIGPEEARLLTAAERPIVLLAAKPEPPAEIRLALEVAPALSPQEGPGWVGLFLPYTPLHHLLLEAAGRPLVMTSGNRSGEPIAYRNSEALERLGKIADLLLLHNRPIAAPCDDSVARVVAGRPTVLRRSRGYVPRPIPVLHPFARPTLACGPQLKNTFCLGLDDSAYLSPHIGDLETLEGLEFFEAAVEHFERLLGVTPELLAHDLHPEFLSTRYARLRAEALGVPVIAVQHHHAHVVAAMAENGLDPEGPVLGVVFDGVGYGEADRGADTVAPRGDESPRYERRPIHGASDSDVRPWNGQASGSRLQPASLCSPGTSPPGGSPRLELSPGDQGTAWGGEILQATAAAHRRLATLRPIPLVGGDTAVRQVWRLALALLDDAFAGDAPEFDRFALFQQVPATLLEGVRRMLTARVHTPLAHGVGRLFDAVGALLLARPEARFEGQVALGLERVAGPFSLREGSTPYPFALDRSTTPWQMDWRPLVRELVEDRLAGVPVPILAARFHTSVAALTGATVAALRRTAGPLPVVLTGGCFQNDRLTGEMLARFRATPEIPIYTHRRVPPGDGGVALGQAVAANALSTLPVRRSPCA